MKSINGLRETGKKLRSRQILALASNPSVEENINGMYCCQATTPCFAKGNQQLHAEKLWMHGLVKGKQG